MSSKQHHNSRKSNRSIRSRYNRDDVIDESIRHLNRQSHIHRDLCIYCGDNADRIPNPFYSSEIPIIGALHYVGHAGKPELCPICTPEVRNIVPDQWK
jgi:hypothetical protein